MRYQDWDVLLFPAASKIPLQEFKTTCHIIHDQEYFNAASGVFLIPTVTSFVPTLEPGEAFLVSIHAWDWPKPSKYIQEYTQHPEHAIYEGRVIIDGRLAGILFFEPKGPSPVLIDTKIGLNEKGEEEALEFPLFRPEVLTQTFWHAGDDLGRIKIIISEGFPRASETMQFERVKPLVAFSFQHAPLGVLESSAIAWPNIEMWRQTPDSIPYFIPNHSDYAELDNTHAHPPRRSTNEIASRKPLTNLSSMPGTNIRLEHADSYHGLMLESGQAIKYWQDIRKTSSTDDSMPDYSSYNSSHNGGSRTVSAPIASDKTGMTNMEAVGAYEHVNAALQPQTSSDSPQRPTFTSSTIIDEHVDDDEPLDENAENLTNTTSGWVSSAQSCCSDFAYTAAPDDVEAERETITIKSRKENLQSLSKTFHGERASTLVKDHHERGSTVDGQSADSKRRRRLTSASSKVVDEEYEPRISAKFRKTSQRVSGRRALSGIDHNIV